jgi:hypothetical protein
MLYDLLYVVYPTCQYVATLCVYARNCSFVAGFESSSFSV